MPRPTSEQSYGKRKRKTSSEKYLAKRARQAVIDEKKRRVAVARSNNSRV
jgi:hypothetical protein